MEKKFEKYLNQHKYKEENVRQQRLLCYENLLVNLMRL